MLSFLCWIRRWVVGLAGLSLTATTALGESLGPSSRRTDWVLSEILFHPAPRADGRNLEFIEIYNAGLIAEDLGGHRISGEVNFVVPRNTLVPAGGFVVLAPSPDDLRAIYGLTQVVGEFTNRLNNAGGRIRLHNPAGAVLLEVEYQATAPWPAAAAGGGHSVVLQRPSFGEADPRAWQASALIGGSPGNPEPAGVDAWGGLVINEWLARLGTSQAGFIELHNRSGFDLDVGGCRLTDSPANAGYRFPPRSFIPGRGFLVVEGSEFPPESLAGRERILLIDPEGTRVIDAIRFGGQRVGVSGGRYPDGGEARGDLRAPTPSLANAAPPSAEVVINEILYRPISGDEAGEYIELHHPGASDLDISGWRIVDGVDFEFPAGTTIPAGGYLVVARDAERLRALHPNLTPKAVTGNFSGSLANGGERIALARPVSRMVPDATGVAKPETTWAVVNEVTYGDGGAWGQWSDGGGSSLELMDPASDNRLAANWADSDESAKSVWTTIETSGILDQGTGTPDRLQIVAQGAGEFLIDDIEVVNASGANLVGNGTFASGINGWTLRGTMEGSAWESGDGFKAPGCLRVASVARGDTGGNRIQAPLSTSPAVGSTATIRAHVRWLRGHPEVLLRLRGNHLEAVGTMMIPGTSGTPGAANSRRVPNVAPSIRELHHDPVLPLANQSVLVSARISDSDGLGRVRLRYRLDPSGTVNELPMTDDGTGGDLVAGDQLFSATLPVFSGGSLVAFQVVAEDARNPSGIAAFPPQEALIRYGETRPGGKLGTYRLWMTQATLSRWSTRPKLDNAPLPVTFVYNDQRVVHGVGALYAGSPHISPGYNSPLGNLCGYVLIFPEDEPFLGATDVVLDWPGRDTTAQQEPMAYWIARELGIPFNHRRYIRLHVNGVTETARGSIYEDAQQVNSDLMESWNPEGTDGDLYKIEQWFEFDDGGGTSAVIPPRLENYTTAGGGKKLARYRWNWLKRAARGSTSDYASLFTLVDAANSTDPAVYATQLRAFADFEEWMRIFATENIVVNLDAWGYDIGKNMYAYKPPGGRWQLHMWDIDWVMLASAQHGYSPTSPLMYRGGAVFGDANRDPVVGRMYNHPMFQRAYWRAIQDAVDGPLVPERVAARMDAVHAALVANGVTRSSGGTLSSPVQVKTWLRQRRDYLMQQLATVSATFTLNSPPAALGGSNVVTLSGTAPIVVADLRVNGDAFFVTWTSVTNWSLAVPLKPGDNVLSVQGFDRVGNAIASAVATASVRYSGTLDSPLGHVVLNEIQTAPVIRDGEFVEVYNRSTNTWFNLSAWRLEGVDGTFPAGSLLPPNGYLVLARDRERLAEAHGIRAVAAGEFHGRLLFNGETLALATPASTGETAMVTDAVTYASTPPWPVPVFGSGTSIQRVDADQDGRHPSNWRVANSSPGQPARVLVPWTQNWRYDQSGRDLGSSWREFGFDDTAWPSGAAILYQEGADLPQPKNTALTLGPLTYYFRTRFNFEGDPASTGLQLSWLLDDGAVAYLNGIEVARLGMPESDVITSTTIAARTVGDASIEGPIALPTSALRRGDNVLAVEAHQISTGSSDVVFGLQLETAAVSGSELATPGRRNSVASQLPTLPPVWINELQPDNRSGPTDLAGEPEPWVELYNAGTETVSLSPCFLSDTASEPTKWQFPVGTQIAPGAFLVVWLDGESAESTGTSLHTGFRLASTNGSLVLSTTNLAGTFVLDALHYGALAPDAAIALIPDGAAENRWTLGSGATPGAGNQRPDLLSQVVINEWMAANTSAVMDPADGDFEDWFELYNPGNQTVDLTGCTLSDQLANPRKYVIPSGTAIGPRGFLLVWADEESSQTQPGGPLHANFKLSQSGESILLSGPDGQIIDHRSFVNQVENSSTGRWPDGATVATNYLGRATPGSANAAPNGETPEVHLLGIAVGSDGGVTVTWEFVAGSTDVLEASDVLTPENWFTVPGEIQTIGNTAAATDPSARQSPARFYRVRRMP
ncbi:MAG: lamin tail domain-containing protein [Verrucomicrobiales bacterium]|nr:lamin tail domain-containing protein [Verrucomicrobiales bacterium]